MMLQSQPESLLLPHEAMDFNTFMLFHVPKMAFLAWFLGKLVQFQDIIQKLHALLKASLFTCAYL